MADEVKAQAAEPKAKPRWKSRVSTVLMVLVCVGILAGIYWGITSCNAQQAENVTTVENTIRSYGWEPADVGYTYVKRNPVLTASVQFGTCKLKLYVYESDPTDLTLVVPGEVAESTFKLKDMPYKTLYENRFLYKLESCFPTK